MKACQAAVDSPEFTEWIAYWMLEAEASQQPGEAEPQREPTRDELSSKIHAWVAKHNASLGITETPRKAKV